MPATIVRLKSGKPVKLDDGPATIEFVRNEMFRSGWTYNRLRAATGLSKNCLHKLASGTTKSPGLTTIIRILTALGWQVYAD